MEIYSGISSIPNKQKLEKHKKKNTATKLQQCYFYKIQKIKISVTTFYVATQSQTDSTSHNNSMLFVLLS